MFNQIIIRQGAISKLNNDTLLLDTNVVDKDTGKLSYKDTRDAAIESHRKTFPFSQCSKKCLKAQLDSYYRKNCDKDLDYKKMSGGVDAGAARRESGI